MKVPTIALDILEQTHTLIAGTTGCGKSTLLHSVMFTALASGNKWTILIDPKQTELRKYRKCSGVIQYANTASQAADALDTALAIMRQRQSKAARKGWSMYNGDDIYVLIDELADLMISAEGKRIKAQLQELLQLSRASRIHVIACTQSPSRQTIIAPIALNCTCKIGMACESAIESRQIIGTTGCEFLPLPVPSDLDQRRLMIVKVAGRREMDTWYVPYITEDRIDDIIKSHPRRFFQGMPA